jgi:flagellar biosynthetic protein FliQ
MTSDALVGLFEQTMLTLLATAGPILLGTLAVGLVVSILQAATQVSEPTLTFLPKLAVTALIFIVLGPWMLDRFLAFTRAIFALTETVAG